MKYFQIVLVLVMMALTTPLFYVQATKEINRSQTNKGLIEASTKSKLQSSLSSILTSSVVVESSSSPSTSSSVDSSSSSSSSLEVSSNSIEVVVSSSSSIVVSSSTKPEVKVEKLDTAKDELTAKILKSIEEKKIEEARKEELSRQIIKKEAERIAALKAEEERKAAEAKKIEEKKAAEEARIAEEKRIESEKKAIEEKRIADEKAKELAAKLAAEAPKKLSAAVSGSFSEAIDTQCANYGCNAAQLKRIMMCESTGNANAQNGIYTGLFQFHPQTFAAYSARAGLSGASIYNGYDQIATAAYMFANGEARQWECK